MLSSTLLQGVEYRPQITGRILRAPWLQQCNGADRCGNNIAESRDCGGFRKSDLFTTCPETCFVISNMVTCFLPPKTAFEDVTGRPRRRMDGAKAQGETYPPSYLISVIFGGFTKPSVNAFPPLITHAYFLPAFVRAM
jgi:hypothetical protein